MAVTYDFEFRSTLVNVMCNDLAIARVANALNMTGSKKERTNPDYKTRAQEINQNTIKQKIWWITPKQDDLHLYFDLTSGSKALIYLINGDLPNQNFFKKLFKNFNKHSSDKCIITIVHVFNGCLGKRADSPDFLKGKGMDVKNLVLSDDKPANQKQLEAIIDEVFKQVYEQLPKLANEKAAQAAIDPSSTPVTSQPPVSSSSSSSTPLAAPADFLDEVTLDQIRKMSFQTAEDMSKITIRLKTGWKIEFEMEKSHGAQYVTELDNRLSKKISDKVTFIYAEKTL